MHTYLLLGVFLFSVGTLLGIPHGLSKRHGKPAVTELWRVAHLSTCVRYFANRLDSGATAVISWVRVPRHDAIYHCRLLVLWCMHP